MYYIYSEGSGQSGEDPQTMMALLKSTLARMEEKLSG